MGCHPQGEATVVDKAMNVSVSHEKVPQARFSLVIVTNLMIGIIIGSPVCHDRTVDEGKLQQRFISFRI